MFFCLLGEKIGIKHNQIFICQGKTKHVKLKSYELELLKQISIHRIMHAKSIHHFIQEMTPNPLHSNGISNRLKLLVDEEILSRQFLDVSVTRAPARRYYYMLGRKGFRMLVNSGYFLYDRESVATYRKSRDSEIPSIHTDAMSILANKIFLACQEDSGRETLQHFRGADACIPIWHGEDQRFGMEGNHIPDWVFTNDEQYICIEMDTGSQSLKMITKKVEYYNQLNQRRFNKDSDYKLILVFAVLDDSIVVVKSFKKENRSKRIGSLKAHIANLSLDFSEIYVVSAKRAHLLIKSFTAVTQTLAEGEENQDLSLLIQTTLSQNTKYSISEKTLPTTMNNTMIQTWALSTIEIQMRKFSQSIFLVMMREGHIETWRRMNNAMNYARDWNKHFHNNELVIISCYENEEAAIHDVIGLELDAKLYKTSMQAWEEANEKKQHMPRMIQMGGPYRQGWNF